MSDIVAVKIDTSDIKKVEIMLGELKDKAPLAISRALNRAAKHGRTAAVKEISKNYYIKSRDAAKEIIVNQAYKNRLQAMIYSSGEKYPLDKFKYAPKGPRHKKPPKSIKVTIKKTNGPKDFRHVFVANANGDKIFERTGKFGRMSRGYYAGLRREKIRRVPGQSVPQILGTKKMSVLISKQVLEMYQKRLPHEIKRIQEAKE